ncbi:hypothetical protein GCM10011380_00460 [Sphingomonas metalli]|uniref:Uncharacterized protein n=1 Tax=Sphingomonas metalli TaxID=1779358 RepID=A0A916WM17_9SPHN|nr:hypothetical protein [Sphingomonas metalli]GGB14964.1 hypothetical protein GCM10011380_00460 [Sphingomonas metalli]
MSITYRPPSTKAIPPCPPEFAENLAKGGWELVERLYGGRTDLHLKWIAMSGAQCRMPKRRVVNGCVMAAVTPADPQI